MSAQPLSWKWQMKFFTHLVQKRRGPEITQYTDGQDQVIEQRTWFLLPLLIYYYTSSGVSWLSHKIIRVLLRTAQVLIINRKYNYLWYTVLYNMLLLFSHNQVRPWSQDSVKIRPRKACDYPNLRSFGWVSYDKVGVLYSGKLGSR